MQLDSSNSMHLRLVAGTRPLAEGIVVVVSSTVPFVPHAGRAHCGEGLMSSKRGSVYIEGSLQSRRLGLAHVIARWL